MGGDLIISVNGSRIAINKGVEVLIRKVAPLGDPIEVNIRGYELTLKKMMQKVLL